jgi:hypothetical protein
LELAAESRKATLGYGARSTSTSMLTSSRPKEGGTTATTRRTVATERAVSFGGGVIRRMRRRRKARYGGFESFPHPRGLFGSGHCDRAQLHRYPLSLGTPNIRESEPG